MWPSAQAAPESREATLFHGTIPAGESINLEILTIDSRRFYFCFSSPEDRAKWILNPILFRDANNNTSGPAQTSRLSGIASQCYCAKPLTRTSQIVKTRNRECEDSPLAP
ncbi:hypothetical protein DTO169E5_6731 [Paecilomyces variotii]|nr:hypothetical protein DTO169E5_6731 [Paecilomyces variotii]KAJ9350929.1 hypothetical protein DTO027B9_6674 [Paecilomyces variotii]